jgi:aminomethyltransferase
MASSAVQELLKTSLYDVHRRAGARMVPFGGWDMPVQYRGIVAEHLAVREGAGLFDLSHMGRLYFQGQAGKDLLQWLSTNNVDALASGRAQYGLLCNNDGGILDDTVAYNLGDDLLLVVNASNRQKILDWAERQEAAEPSPQPSPRGRGNLEPSPQPSVGGSGSVCDATFETVMVGLQGPRAEAILQPLTDVHLPDLRYYAAERGRVADIDAFVARTGYTGEDGFELIVSADDGPDLWHTLARRHDPIQPTLCGLGARDTLRLEAGMALYGHEITEDTNPFEANLGRVVKLDKGDFVGCEALAALSEKPPERRLVGFQMVDNAVPRQGYPIVSADRVVGQVTSGSFSPSLRRNLGMAYVPSALSEPGVEIAVVVREQPRRAVVVQLPHYPHRTRRR